MTPTVGALVAWRLSPATALLGYGEGGHRGAAHGRDLPGCEPRPPASPPAGRCAARGDAGGAWVPACVCLFLETRWREGSLKDCCAGSHTPFTPNVNHPRGSPRSPTWRC